MKRGWKKWAGTMTAAAILAGAVWGSGYAPDAHAANAAFSDMKSTHWAYGAVQKGVANGYVDGYVGGTFKPDNSVTRAEFVKMVVVAMKLDTAPASGKWYVPYVEAASKAGLYDGGDFSNSEAAWTKVMTRDEMARVAARAIGEKTSENDKWMYLATKSGLIQGVGKGKVAPEGLTTRAQSVVIIERILTAKAGGDLDTDRYATAEAEILWHGTNIFTVMPEMFVTPESDWKNKGKKSIEEMWNEKNMTITSKDGLYQAKLDALIAIDMADKNDPNRGLLGNINTLRWSNNKQTMDKLMVKDNLNTYVLYFKGKQVFNKDTNKYTDKDQVSFRVYGFDTNNLDAFYAGKLNSTADIYQKKWFDTPAVIIPKSGTVQMGHDLSIMLQTPAGGSLYMTQDLLRLRGI
ncbi:S-layer homology domain-containing protein [Saccharibacillus alkalitolerans]|uniref:S-layer homology domain-containing protein n=1 Tax=Saccharibacillus alkalitolerans TaxID=2705290 RepID=A0ABX0FA66_9BACL|nr:S-layer homology domain-containing protein [Saccharibacillus alkalitolerans]NGZ77315.1 S-layer homology domain-containing protein [Saccharibacillus alkalitolerans]